MRREKMWRAIALIMTIVALTAVAVTLVSASGPSSPPAQETTDQDAGRQYEWSGVIFESDLEGGHLALKTRCGVWALTSEDDEVIADLRERMGQEVDVWGAVYRGASIVMRRTINVQHVFGEGEEKPQTLVEAPNYCEAHPGPDHDRPQPKPQPHQVRPVPVPHSDGGFGGILGQVLRRLAGAELQGLTRDERFEHFLGLQLQVLNAEGDTVEIAAVPGIVVSNDGETLTVDPNGDATEQSYPLEGVKVLRAGGGDADDIAEGDEVVVVTKDGEPVVVIASRQVTVWPHVGPTPRPLPHQGRAHGESSIQVEPLLPESFSSEELKERLQLQREQLHDQMKQMEERLRDRQESRES